MRDLIIACLLDSARFAVVLGMLLSAVSAEAQATTTTTFPPPPPGCYSAVSGGADHVCALRTDNDIDCWGNVADGVTAPPAGPFAQVSDQWYASCARTSAGAVSCWGSSILGNLTPAAGTYATIAGGKNATCGLLTDQSIACWGDNRFINPSFDLENGYYRNACNGGASNTDNCTTNADCTDGTCNATGFPAGTFTAIAMGRDNGCAIKASDSSAECWGSPYTSVTTETAGSYSAIAVAQAWACALKTSDSTIVCWGDSGDASGILAGIPSGAYSAIDAGLNYVCAIRTSDSALVCWGSDSSGQVSGAFVGAVTGLGEGVDTGCVIAAPGDINCWGADDYGDVTNAPAHTCSLPSASGSALIVFIGG